MSTNDPTLSLLRDLIHQQGQQLMNALGRVEGKLDGKVDRHELERLEKSTKEGFERLQGKIETVANEHDERLRKVEASDLAAVAVLTARRRTFAAGIALGGLIIGLGGLAIQLVAG